jgi:hypothetical protein
MNIYIFKIQGRIVIVKELRRDLAEEILLAHTGEVDYELIEEFDSRDREILYDSGH